jgi:hypothetical protein
MHEAGIAERLLEVALARAAAAGSDRVLELELEIGEANDADLDALAVHWPIVSAGTIADGAVLRFTRVATPTPLRLVAIEASKEAEGGSTVDATRRDAPTAARS